MSSTQAALPPSLELRVLSGLQAGACLPLAQGEFVLGSDEVCDVLLVGPGIGPQALRLEISEEGVCAEPLQPDCVINGEAVSSGDVVLEADSAFRVSDVWLCVDCVDAPWPAPGSWLERKPVQKTCAIACVPEAPALPSRSRPAWLKSKLLAMALIVGSGLGGYNNSSSARSDLEATPAIDVLPPAPKAAPPVSVMAFTASRDADAAAAPAAKSRVPVIREARLALEAEIVALELERRVITFIANDRVWIVGAAENHKVVDAAVARLKQTHGDVFVFADGDRGPATASPASASPATLPFKVRQVTCGTLPSISLDDGQKLYEGATYKGYVLERVDDGQLVLRGARRVVLAC